MEGAYLNIHLAMFTLEGGRRDLFKEKESTPLAEGKSMMGCLKKGQGMGKEYTFMTMEALIIRANGKMTKSTAMVLLLVLESFTKGSGK